MRLRKRIGFGVRIAWKLARVSGGQDFGFRGRAGDEDAADAEGCWCGLAFGGFGQREAEVADVRILRVL